LAQFPGASAEEVERQVSVPLEVTFAGMPRLKALRSVSRPGLACVQAEFADSFPYEAARQEVINRLAVIAAPLPAGVTPLISPASSCPSTYRYTLSGPKDQLGRAIYTLNDVRALQDWVLDREFRTVPRIVDVSTYGGTIRRYEVQPDPDRLSRYGITLDKLQRAVAESNANVKGDYVGQGQVALSVRSVGLFGGGQDPVQKAVGLDNPTLAAAHLRAEEQRRIRDIRNQVIATSNNMPVRVDHVVDGGPLVAGILAGEQGVVVSCRPRQGRVGISRLVMDGEGRPVRDAEGNVAWDDHDDSVAGVIYLRRGEDAIAWRDVRAKLEQLNAPGKVLPGVQLEPYLEGNQPDHFWVRVLFPVNIALDRAVVVAGQARGVVRGYPEVAKVVSEVGTPEDNTAPVGGHAGLLCVTLRPAKEWPNVVDGSRPRTKQELMDVIGDELERKLPGIAWDCLSQYREGLWADCAADADEAVLKIIGPNLDELEKLAALARPRLQEVAGVHHVRILPVKGGKHLEFGVDREKCSRWGISVNDVQNVLSSALGGKTMSSMIEGEKLFDITVRWPARLRRDEQSILDIPLDVLNNEPVANPGNPIGNKPRLRLRDLVSPLGADGAPDPEGAFTRAAAAAIYREQGQRLILLRVGVRGRGQAAVRGEAEQKIAQEAGIPESVVMGMVRQGEHRHIAGEQHAAIGPEAEGQVGDVAEIVVRPHPEVHAQ